MEITDGTVEEQPPDPRQDRVTEVPMERWHGTRADAAREAVAHHEVVTLPKLLHERTDRGEVVAVVGIAHDDEAPTGSSDATEQRAPVSLLLHIDHSSS